MTLKRSSAWPQHTTTTSQQGCCSRFRTVHRLHKEAEGTDTNPSNTPPPKPRESGHGAIRLAGKALCQGARREKLQPPRVWFAIVGLNRSLLINSEKLDSELSYSSLRQDKARSSALRQWADEEYSHGVALLFSRCWNRFNKQRACVASHRHTATDFSLASVPLTVAVTPSHGIPHKRMTE